MAGGGSGPTRAEEGRRKTLLLKDEERRIPYVSETSMKASD
jgi:hypothetical protein